VRKVRYSWPALKTLARVTLAFMLPFLLAPALARDCESPLLEAGLSELEVLSIQEWEKMGAKNLPLRVLARENENGEKEVIVLLGEEHKLKPKLSKAVEEQPLLRVFENKAVEGGPPFVASNAEYLALATAAFFVRVTSYPFVKLAGGAPAPSSMVLQKYRSQHPEDPMAFQFPQLETLRRFKPLEIATMFLWAMNSAVSLSLAGASLLNLPAIISGEGPSATWYVLASLFASNYSLYKLAYTKGLQNIPGLRFFRGYEQLRHRDPYMARQLEYEVSRIEPSPNHSTRTLLAIVGNAHVEGIQQNLHQLYGFKEIYSSAP
jgi:hypothetical protein